MCRLPILLIYLLTTCCIAVEYKTGILIEKGFKSTDELTFASHDVFINKDTLSATNLMVDKSFLIKDLVEDDGKVYLITTPRGWGKSQNLNMLREFFQKYEYHLVSRTSYSLFVEGGKFQRSFLIADYKDIIDEHLGKYPVIYMRLIVIGRNFAEWLKNFQCAINYSFGFHVSEVDATLKAIIDDEENDHQTIQDARKRLKKFMDHQVPCYEVLTGPELDPEDVLESMAFLCETLYLCYDKKLIILMDEYFEPWFKLFRTEELVEKYKENCLNFYNAFMTATFRDNILLKKAILTGILPPSEELRKQVFPNATLCNSLTGKFMEHFSFHQWELEKLFDVLHTPNASRQEVDRWYKGYRVNNRDLIIYNAISINKFLSENKTDNYWIETGGLPRLIENFLQVPSFEEKWKLLELGGSITLQLESEYFTWADYEYLIRALVQPVAVQDEYTDRAYMLLFALGYLTLSENVDITTHRYRMKFPNEEIRSSMKRKETST